MPKITQYRIVKAQVESFKELGCVAAFDIQGYNRRFAAKIRIITDTKSYQFSEANWDLVSSKLAKLYKKLASSFPPSPEQNGE